MVSSSGYGETVTILYFQKQFAIFISLLINVVKTEQLDMSPCVD